MPCLLNTQTSQRYELSGLLDGEWVMLGRVQTPLFTSDHCTSRYHATVIRKGDCFVLVDHSLNGTRVQTDQEYKTNSAPSAFLSTVLFKEAMIPEQSQVYKPASDSRRAVVFDRSTQTSYFEEVKRFVEALKDPSQRDNYFSLGFKLRKNMQLCFGGDKNAPVYQFIV